MDINTVSKIVNGKILHESKSHNELTFGFSSDLMSDVLRFRMDNTILITGLSNIQTMRTAEISNIECIVFARNKTISDDMTDHAIENDISVITSPLSLFEVSGLLYSNGIKPIDLDAV